MTFYGSSFIADPTGAIAAELPRDAEGVVTAAFDLDEVAKMRASPGACSATAGPSSTARSWAMTGALDEPRRYAFCAAVLGLWLVAAAPAPVELASVRATYEVSLEHALPAGLVAVRGRTAIEFRNTCDGYETTQRFLADMTNAQGNVSRSDFAVTAWESRNGRAMRFDITNMVDGEVAERYKGRASNPTRQARARSRLRSRRASVSPCRRARCSRRHRPSP